MNFLFDNQEQVQYTDSYFGTGKGVVVGFYENKNGVNLYVIYPKTPFEKSFWPFMTIVVKESQLISTPF
jgi:hypothetical protein